MGCALLSKYYVCEAWCLVLKAEHELRAFEGEYLDVRERM
jgi:hypothetical protein